jgi:polar amino acid transport system permease protein
VNLENIALALDVSVFWEFRHLLLRGLLVNAAVFALAAVLAIALGFLACLLRLSHRRPLRAVGTLHAEIFRNSPEYVFLIWVHFVLPLLISYLLATRVSFPPFYSAVLALGLTYSGYFTETFRAGIQAIPRGHLDAGRALGMSGRLVMRRIVLPQAARRMLPEALNQLVSLFKATSIVSLITVPDMMYQVAIITSTEMKPLPLYSSAAFVYFGIIFAMSTLVRRLTDRWRMAGWV